MSAKKKPADSPRPVAAKNTHRSRITNGKLFSGVDLRRKCARRWRDLYADLMGRAGGKHEQTCRALASVILQREVLDARLASGEPVDPLHLVRLSGEARRLMARLETLAESGPLPADAPGWLIGQREASAS